MQGVVKHASSEPMKIGVISDSHDRLKYLKKATDILKDEGISVLIHLGDFISPFTIPYLDFKKVHAIFGNNDGDKLFLQKKAGEMGFEINEGPLIIEKGGRKIIIMHEPRGLEAFRESGLYDIILFGHLHERTLEEDPLTVNPGELCGYLSGEGSFATIDLDNLTCNFKFI